MYICMHCGHWFDEPTNRYNRTVARPDDEGFCPNCGSDFFDEAEQCELCGEWHAADYLHCGVCKKCEEEKSTVENAFKWGEEVKEGVELNGFLTWAFSVSEIEEILKRELMESGKEKEYANRFCTDDLGMFVEWLKKEEDE